MRRLIGMAAVALLAGLCAAGEGIRLHLRNGSVVTGELISEGGGKYVVSVPLGSGRGTISVDVANVQRVERNVLLETVVAPAGAEPAAGDDEAADDADDTTAGEKAASVAVVPIRGPLGLDDTLNPESVIAEGVRAGLDAARRLKVEHVVIDLEVETGSYAEAAAIADAMGEFDGVFTMHALIRAATGPGVFIAFACDTWQFAAPDDAGVLGGAAGLSDDEAETLTARLVALADRKKHSSALAAGLLLTKAEVYVDASRTGEAQFLARAADGAEAIDGAASVLRLTAGDAARFELGPTVTDAAAIGAVRGDRAWQKPRDHGKLVAKETQAAVRAETQRRATMEALLLRVAEVREIADGLDDIVAEARRADPNNDSYQLFDESDEFTSESAQRWRTNTQRALALWEKAQVAAQESAKVYGRLQRDLDDLAAAQARDGHRSFHEQTTAAIASLRAELEKDDLVKEASTRTLADAATEIATLRANINKTRP